MLSRSSYYKTLSDTIKYIDAVKTVVQTADFLFQIDLEVWSILIVI